jgi:two-component system OmpR family sensor kinase
MTRGTLRWSIARAVLVAAVLGGGVVLAAGMLFPGDRLALAIALVGTLVAAWIAAASVARRLAAPLDRLAATSASFTAGDHSARAQVDGPREVRQMAEALNNMAAELEGAKAQVRNEQRRSSQFISDVSHELRTPLTAIRGAAETLLDGDVDADDQERFLSTIASEAGRLTRLANDLLTLQRIEGATGELPLRRVDLRVAIDRAALMFEPILEERGATLTVNGKAPVVLGDVDRLQQVIANLVDNASRIVGEGGHVTVELSETDEGDARVAISDNGPGIAEEDLARLFDRFYKTDTSRTRSAGSGLGLAIVKAIVTMHGGTVTAENLPERGSRFTVVLPSLHDVDSSDQHPSSP